jgi:hypothetical protein
VSHGPDLAEQAARLAKKIHGLRSVAENRGEACLLLDDEGPEGPRSAPLLQELCARCVGVSPRYGAASRATAVRLSTAQGGSAVCFIASDSSAFPPRRRCGRADNQAADGALEICKSHRLSRPARQEDPEVIAKILSHLELPVDPPEPAPARSLDWLPGFAVGTE